MPSDLARWTADQLDALGYAPDFRADALLAEASHRHFYRIKASTFRSGAALASPATTTTFVVMSSPPEKENNAEFLRLARVFAAHQVGVPDIIAQASDSGYFLLSDLGQQHFSDVYQTDDRDRALAAGIDTLVNIQAIADPALPHYEAQRFRDELQIFREWFVERWLAADFPHHDLDAVFERLIANTQEQTQCCVHRDFHCRNLLFKPDTRDHQVGVVDFQDALVGPVSYDLASLLRDCYHRFSESQISRWRDYYLKHSPLTLNAGEFATHLDLTAVQRQLKAVGIFARLQLRDAKSSHLSHIAPVLSHLEALAGRYPDLAPLRSHLVRWRGDVEIRLEGAS